MQAAQDIENNTSSAPVAEVIAPTERTATDTTTGEKERKSSCCSIFLRVVLAFPLLALGAASLAISGYLFLVRILGFPPCLIPYPCDADCGCLSMYNTIRKSSFMDGLCTFVLWPGAMQTDTDVCDGPCCGAWDNTVTLAGFAP